MFSRFRRKGCPCQTQLDDVVDEAVVPVITLVHGTWAQHTWVRKKKDRASRDVSASEILKRFGSQESKKASPPQTEDLYDALRRRIPSARIHRFCWSGGNSNTKRLKAAAELQAYLKRLLSKYPNGRHFLVGHSHGGTVSLYALKDPALGDDLAGVVTLATPFLHFNRRPLPGFILWWNAAIQVISLTVMVVGLSGFDDGGNVIGAIQFPSPWWWLAASVVASGLIGAGLIVVSALMYRGSEFGPMSLLGLRDEQTITEEVARLRLPDIERTKLYVVRGPGDEAAGGLASSQFLFSWLITRVLAYLNVRRVIGAWRSLVTILLMLTVGLNVLGFFGDTSSFFAQIAFTSLFVLALGGGVLTSLGLLILVVGSIPFAWDAGFLGLVVQTTAEPMPPGAVSVYQLGESAREGLDHSIQHRIKVHDLMQDWMDVRMSTLGGGSPEPSLPGQPGLER